MAKRKTRKLLQKLAREWPGSLTDWLQNLEGDNQATQLEIARLNTAARHKLKVNDATLRRERIELKSGNRAVLFKKAS